MIDIPKAAADVKVTTQWIDSCSVAISRLPSGGSSGDVEGAGAKEGNPQIDTNGLTLQADEALAQLTLGHDQERAGGDWKGAYLVEAVVPELFSVDVVVSHGNVSVAKKLKGDCKIRLQSGNISTGVVRGETIRLSTGSGRVGVDELEGNVDIVATTDVSRCGPCRRAVVHTYVTR